MTMQHEPSRNAKCRSACRRVPCCAPTPRGETARAGHLSFNHYVLCAEHYVPSWPPLTCLILSARLLAKNHSHHGQQRHVHRTRPYPIYLGRHLDLPLVRRLQTRVGYTEGSRKYTDSQSRVLFLPPLPPVLMVLNTRKRNPTSKYASPDWTGTGGTFS